MDAVGGDDKVGFVPGAVGEDDAAFAGDGVLVVVCGSFVVFHDDAAALDLREEDAVEVGSDVAVDL